MIRKSGYRFSEKIMLKQKKIEWDDDSKKSHPALGATVFLRTRADTAEMAIAHDDRFVERDGCCDPLRLQGVADRRGASIRADQPWVVVAGRPEVRGLGLRRYC